MNSMEVVSVGQPVKKRYGLIAARIGRSFGHKLGVAMPLETPAYSTTMAKVPGMAPARTRLGGGKSHIEFGRREGHNTPVPVRALPGATVQLEVQDITRLEADLAPHVKWVCMHPGCAGARFDSKDELFRAHEDNARLVEDAERDPRGGAPHLFYAVLELAGKPEKKDKDGKVVQEEVAPQVMILSDES